MAGEVREWPGMRHNRLLKTHAWMVGVAVIFHGVGSPHAGTIVTQHDPRVGKPQIIRRSVPPISASKNYRNNSAGGELRRPQRPCDGWLLSSAPTRRRPYRIGWQGTARDTAHRRSRCWIAY